MGKQSLAGRPSLLWAGLAVMAAVAGVAAYVNRDLWAKLVKPVTAGPVQNSLLDESTAATAKGSFDVRLSTRSPLGDPAAVAARCGINVKNIGSDYQLKDERFAVYKPAAPGPDGKYGLMVGLCFEEYGQPPGAWAAVLEARHLIWICAYNNGDDRPQAARVGLLLDAAAAGPRLWPVDPARVYLSAGTYQGRAAGAAFYYPEVFRGCVMSPGPVWFDEQGRSFPPPQQWDRDRADGWWVVASRVAADPSKVTRYDLYQSIYDADKFRHHLWLDVPEAQIGHYVNYAGGWFDQAVVFLDRRVGARRFRRSCRR